MQRPHPVHSQSWLCAARTTLLGIALAMLACAAGAANAPRPALTSDTQPQDTAPPPTHPPGAQPVESKRSQDTPLDAERLFGAVVKISARAVPDARSAATLGTEREGSGVVIGRDGLVLTIGYLIVEADEVKVTDSHGRTLPAQVVAYDHNSGFGLIRTILPLDAEPIALGDSKDVEEREPVLIASAADDGASFAFVVSRRPFTGSWEYQLDSALYTSPPASNWSGAALINRDGKLIGIGSLIVREATDSDPRLPGNVFVPIDLLKPILADLLREGHRAGPARPWLGISADELQGRVVVTRVSPEGPADRAGLQAGDIILAVGEDAVTSQSDLYQKLWSRSKAGDEITLKVLQGRDVNTVKVRSIDRQQYFRPKTTI
jgi:S1-C subfamily serine protease